MTTDGLQLELVIVRDGDPQIHGSLGAPAQDPVSFIGWLELISLVDRLSHLEPSPKPGASAA